MPIAKKVNSEIVVLTDDINELNLERSIDLNPEDWFWDKSQPRKVLPRPLVQPFDLQAAISKISQIRNSKHHCLWDWSSIDIPISQSSDEARFWLMAMTIYAEARKIHQKLTERKIHKYMMTTCQRVVTMNCREIVRTLFSTLSDKEEPTPKSLSQLFQKLSQESGKLEQIDLSISLDLASFIEQNKDIYLPQQIVIPLINLFPIADVVNQLKLEFWSAKELISYIIPYLHETEINDLRQKLVSVDLNQWLGSSVYFSVYFAAYLGWDNDVETWIRQLPEDLDSYNLPYKYPIEWVILGLPDVDTMSHHMRRLKLILNEPEYLAGWIARTKYAELDWVCHSILQSGTKEQAVELLQILGKVRASETAPFMLELMLSSKAPQVAGKWLQDNPAYAIAGLIPVATKRGKLADAAIEFLRSMKLRGYGEYIQTCLKRESTNIASKIRSTVLDFEKKSYPPFDESNTPEWLQ